jgi:uncharacterized protein (DUF486 family)
MKMSFAWKRRLARFDKSLIGLMVVVAGIAACFYLIWLMTSK